MMMTSIHGAFRVIFAGRSDFCLHFWLRCACRFQALLCAVAAPVGTSFIPPQKRSFDTFPRHGPDNPPPPRSSSAGTGSNDVANAFGTSVGSKTLTLMQATVIAIVFEFTGALVLGRVVQETIAGGIADISAFQTDPEFFAYGAATTAVGLPALRLEQRSAVVDCRLRAR